MRLFLAVFPSPAAQGAAFAGIESLRRPGDRVSWVQRQNLHYTMRFLGEVGEDGLRRASEAARQAAAAHAAFDAALGALGAFPSPRRARVLWIGMTLGEPPLLALASSAAASRARAGPSPPISRSAGCASPGPTGARCWSRSGSMPRPRVSASTACAWSRAGSIRRARSTPCARRRNWPDEARFPLKMPLCVHCPNV